MSSDDKDLVSYGPFIQGVNNRLQDHEFPPDAMRQAVNVRLTDTGRLERRSGYAIERAAAVKSHSSFGSKEYGVLLVDGTNLILYNPESGAETVLRSDMNPELPVAYVELPGGDIYYSDSIVSGRFSKGIDLPWGIAPPSGVPVLTQITGALPPGRYQVALTYLTATGEESGASLVGQATIGTGKGLRMTGIAAPVTVGVVGIALYVSAPNVEILYHAADLPLGATQFDYLTASASGRALKTMHITPPPAGTVLAYSSGRIFIAAGPIVWYTEALQYGRCRRSSNFLLFPSDVTLMAGVKSGVFVASDQTYWVAGADPAAADLRVVLPFGAAKGSLTALPKADTWAWYSDQGLVRATADGTIEELQSERLALDAASVGATLYMEEDGVKEIVSITKPRALAAVASADGFLDMEVRRAKKVLAEVFADTAAATSSIDMTIQ